MKKSTGIINIYPEILVEGKYSGVPHIIIEMAGCNLRCDYCSIQNAIWNEEGGTKVLTDLKAVIEQNPKIHHFLISGGEPTQNIVLLKRIIEYIRKKQKDSFISVRTNGTLFVKTESVDYWIIKPKLGLSDPVQGFLYAGHECTNEILEEHYANRTNVPAVQKLIAQSKGNFELNFNISDKPDTEEAIDYFRKVFNKASWNDARSWIWFVLIEPSINVDKFRELCLQEGINCQIKV